MIEVKNITDNINHKFTDNDIQEFERYREFLNDDSPASACIQISRLVLGCRVEIEDIAYIP